LRRCATGGAPAPGPPVVQHPSSAGAPGRGRRAMTVTAEHVQQVAHEVWRAFLGLEVTRLPDGDARSSAADRGEQLVASVGIQGAWRGAVRVRCSRAAAARFAAGLLEVRPADVDDVQAADAVGELANIFGGNLKALLPGPSGLSTPVVTRQTLFQPGARRRDLTELTRVQLWSDGHPFEVTVLAG